MWVLYPLLTTGLTEAHNVQMNHPRSEQVNGLERNLRLPYFPALIHKRMLPLHEKGEGGGRKKKKVLFIYGKEKHKYP